MTTSLITTEDARLVELAELFDESIRMYVVNDDMTIKTTGDERQQHRDSAAYWVDLAVGQAIEICSLRACTEWGVSAQANAFELIQDHESAGAMFAQDGVNVLDPKL